MVVRTVRPKYFDWPQRSDTVPVKGDLTSDSMCRNSDNPAATCLEYRNFHHLDYVAIYTDGSVDTVNGPADCRFFVNRDNFRYGLALQPYTSILTAELYAIFT